MIDRIKLVAQLRGKNVLLYAIQSAIGFYLKHGFTELKGKFCVDFKAHQGSYMVYRI